MTTPCGGCLLPFSFPISVPLSGMCMCLLVKCFSSQIINTRTFLCLIEVRGWREETSALSESIKLSFLLEKRIVFQGPNSSLISLMTLPMTTMFPRYFSLLGICHFYVLYVVHKVCLSQRLVFLTFASNSLILFISILCIT